VKRGGLSPQVRCYVSQIGADCSKLLEMKNNSGTASPVTMPSRLRVNGSGQNDKEHDRIRKTFLRPHPFASVELVSKAFFKLVNIEHLGLVGAEYYLQTVSNMKGGRPMLPSQKEPWSKLVSPELYIQETPRHTVAVEKATPSNESVPATANSVAQFRFRILVVDDEPSVREMARQVLESEGYEVLTAKDGLGGLNALSKSLPDLIISDLNMPWMSGFEFLAIVRKRFPHIATIATSGDYVTSGNPSGILADAFLQKGQYTIHELFHEIAELLAASPIRSEGEKSDNAPLFVPRDNAGYLIITCPKCLRPNRLEAISLNGGIHQTMCQSCGEPVKFEINHEIEPLIKRKYA